ncbi:MAG: hypothetical protein WKF43_11320 [Acidimicrobiales bacterium]
MELTNLYRRDVEIKDAFGNGEGPVQILAGGSMVVVGTGGDPVSSRLSGALRTFWG